MADELPPAGEAEGTEEKRAPLDRDRDLLGRRNPNAPLRRHLDELFTTIARGFEAQQERSDKLADYWDCYNCTANGNRYYNGIADIYFPIIHDAVEARVTRFSNQMCPQGGRYVQATASDGTTKAAYVALLDHYLRGFKTNVLAPLIRNGDIEGQYNLYVDWNEVERQIVSRETHGPRDPQTGIEGPGEEIEDIVEEDVLEGSPVLEVLHDSDVLVLPATADSIEEALAGGGCVVIVRRWSKDKIKRMGASGNVRKDEANRLHAEMGKIEPGSPDVERHLLEHVQIRKDGKEATVWEVWHALSMTDGRYAEDGKKRLYRIFFGPGRAQLGAKRNPYWNDRCPLLSRPVQKMAGVFKGPSLIQYVESLQYEANDAVNEGADAATLSAAPIVTRDPEKYSGPLVYNVGAVWDIPPDAVKLLTFPDLTPRAATRVQMALQAIFQTLGVNPSMLPQQTGKPGAKRNQAEVAMEQQVDLLTTANAVTIIEEGIGTPLAGWIVDLDYQFRDRPLLLRMYGDEGRQAVMEEVGPLQNRHGMMFLWRGGEQVRQTVATLQQGGQFLNLAMNPNLRQALAAEGMTVKLSVLVQHMATSAFGPELGMHIIEDRRAQLSVGQDEENEMLLAGFEVPVHPLDNDEEHLKRLMPVLQQTGDPHGTLRVHAQMHLAARQMKAAAMMQQAMQQNMQGNRPGGPPQMGGGGPRPPQPGAMPAGPRLVAKAQPGQIHPDQMPRAGAVVMPRKF